jgi:hypothetical protein
MLLTSNPPFFRSQLEHVGGGSEVKSSIYWTTLPTPFKAEALKKKKEANFHYYIIPIVCQYSNILNSIILFLNLNPLSCMLWD